LVNKEELPSRVSGGEVAHTRAAKSNRIDKLRTSAAVSACFSSSARANALMISSPGAWRRWAIVVSKYARASLTLCRMHCRSSSVAVARFEALMMSSVQRLKSARRSGSMPSISALTETGKAAEKSRTKSNSPLPRRGAIDSVAIALTCGVRFRIMLGINPLLANLRRRVWAGGSLVIIQGYAHT